MFASIALPYSLSKIQSNIGHEQLIESLYSTKATKLVVAQPLLNTGSEMEPGSNCNIFLFQRNELQCQKDHDVANIYNIIDRWGITFVVIRKIKKKLNCQSFIFLFGMFHVFLMNCLRNNVEDMKWSSFLNENKIIMCLIKVVFIMLSVV